jgi:hypothetical protein
MQTEFGLATATLYGENLTVELILMTFGYHHWNCNRIAYWHHHRTWNLLRTMYEKSIFLAWLRTNDLSYPLEHTLFSLPKLKPTLTAFNI